MNVSERPGGPARSFAVGKSSNVGRASMPGKIVRPSFLAIVFLEVPTNVNAENISFWGADWAWGLPLIVVSVIFHVIGLNFIKRQADRHILYASSHKTVAVGFLALSVTLLHAIEAMAWAMTFWRLGAVPDTSTAMLYSLNALTAFGHTDITLERKWQLMGAMESLNGWILFGLSTAYLFVLIQMNWAYSPRTRDSENPE